MSEKRTEKALALPGWRLSLVLAGLTAGFAVIGVKLVMLHSVQSPMLKHQAALRTIKSEVLPAVRGSIYDRNGVPVAISAPVHTLWVNPGRADPDQPEWAQAAALLELDEAALREDIRQRAERGFMYLKRHVSPDLAAAVKTLKLEGLAADSESKRFYPAGEVAAHVAGLTNVDDSGQEGIELAYNEWLSGSPGKRKVLKDREGHVIDHLELEDAARDGRNIQLSLDLRLQYMAYRELKAAVSGYGAKSGSVVMLDVETGELLAMVNQPSFNPNDRSDLEPERMRNRAVTDVFEPGSTMKPFTIAAALESGKYRAGSKIDTSPGYLRLGNYTIRDGANYGVLDMGGVIAKSSNVAAAKIARELGGEHLWGMFSDSGFGQPTGVEYPGERYGVLPSPSAWKPVQLSSLAYGYGMSSTVMQLAQGYQVLANKGVRRPVSLFHRAGQQNEQAPIQVMSADTAVSVVNMLRRVITEGTGKRAAVSGFSVAGKSGTVHRLGAQGYEAEEYSALFAGMAPADNPKIVVVVVIHSPQKGEYYGGEVAAPVFSRIVSDSLRILGVQPDRPDSLLADASASGASSERH
ncbi:peptidoglycan D,D-transpeptidase FtsI family protein [Allohahella sp. A8]|uniref:peptidoglycan D,D-transpeptidase FtsI family protein n=1 Tax=Allohahella sp. A8 TaxID=3141461 RepID=UPI003A7F96DE